MARNTFQATAVIFGFLLGTLAVDAGAQTPNKPSLTTPAMQKPPAALPASVACLAETQQPVEKIGAVSAGGIVWQCQGNRCQANAALTNPTVQMCRALAAQVGVLNALTIGNQRLDAGGLAQCNAGLSKPASPAMTGPIGVPPKPSANTSSPFKLDPPAGAVRFGDGQRGAIPPNATSKLKDAYNPGTGSGKPAGGFVPKDLSGQSALPAMPPFDPAKKSSGGFVPKEQSAAAGKSDKAKRPSPGPIAFTATALTVTGTGALAARLPFTPKTFSTATMTVTGTGSLPERLPFTPRSFSTTPLTATGTGSL